MQKIGHWLRYWLRFAKKAPERHQKPFNQSPNRGLCNGFLLLQRGWEIGVAEQKMNRFSSVKRAQAYRPIL